MTFPNSSLAMPLCYQFTQCIHFPLKGPTIQSQNLCISKTSTWNWVLVKLTHRSTTALPL